MGHLGGSPAKQATLSLGVVSSSPQIGYRDYLNKYIFFKNRKIMLVTLEIVYGLPLTVTFLYVI